MLLLVFVSYILIIINVIKRASNPGVAGLNPSPGTKYIVVLKPVLIIYHGFKPIWSKVLLNLTYNPIFYCISDHGELQGNIRKCRF